MGKEGGEGKERKGRRKLTNHAGNPSEDREEDVD
jgi:hypothetical protein